MMNLPGARRAFPPWVISAYHIALKNGFRGTEREFRLLLEGEDGIYQMPMILVTEADETEVPGNYEMIMHPSPEEYAYSTERNDFLAADEEVMVPDGMTINGNVLQLTCDDDPVGQPVTLPAADLPDVTADDNGKILKVISGEWAEGTM